MSNLDEPLALASCKLCPQVCTCKLMVDAGTPAPLQSMKVGDGSPGRAAPEQPGRLARAKAALDLEPRFEHMARVICRHPRKFLGASLVLTCLMGGGWTFQFNESRPEKQVRAPMWIRIPPGALSDLPSTAPCVTSGCQDPVRTRIPPGARYLTCPRPPHV
jgi:hypothetical protein